MTFLNAFYHLSDDVKIRVSSWIPGTWLILAEQEIIVQHKDTLHRYNQDRGTFLCHVKANTDFYHKNVVWECK